MGLFKKKAVAKVGKKAFGGSKKTKKNNANSDQLSPQEIAEYKKLKAQAETDAEMRKKWKRYYDNECQGDCDACEYYDWCPEDYADEHEEDEDVAANPVEIQEPIAQSDDMVAGDAQDASDSEEEEEDDVIELDDAEYQAYCAAVDFYNAGCDGECDACPHYEWCPAEEEIDEDDKVIIGNLTGGQVKEGAVRGMELAKETAQTAKELKEAVDDITAMFDPRKW